MKLILLISITILFSHPDIQYPKYNNTSNWNLLTSDDSKIWVGWKIENDINWCRSISVLPFNIDDVSYMIEDLENYYQIFDRVTSSTVISDDIVHIRLDMPFPISDRDYIVQYKVEETNNSISYKFKAVSDTSIPESNDCIRLVNAAGEWYLTKIDDYNTEIIYTWNGELRGDFPDFALTRAWETQGIEIINQPYLFFLFYYLYCNIKNRQ